MSSCTITTVSALCVLVIFLVLGVFGDCPNGCSSKGLCINNACVCPEGLSGVDCSIRLPSSLPTLYECPSCYTITVGAPRYFTGPSWRLPDGPIVALNYRGTLKMFQGNGNGELVAEGSEIDDWTPAPKEALSKGQAGQFDSCGSWIMRAFTSAVSPNKVLGFYHAETDCVYANNGQTRKSAGYAVSSNGGYLFTKPGYPQNQLVDTSTPKLEGQPTGEGDFSVILRGNYYYLFFANVEKYYTGVARASIWSEAYPGAFQKYYNGQWNSPGVGGNSSKLLNMPGPQAYVHTPSQSIISVGNSNPYWNQGFMMSVSDDALNWNYLADPIMTPDPTTATRDMFMYPSFMGPMGGYDLGNKFYFFYMWSPTKDWSNRYQILKDITLTYVGPNSTAVGTKLALTTFQNSLTGETWQSTELPLVPYKTTGIVGYIMTRPYPNTFPIYDCFNYTTSDHFVGTAAECSSGAGVTVTRMLGHIWAKRTPGSLAIYRCNAPKNDTFLSTDSNCEGRGDTQTVPFGFLMDGPAITNAAIGYDILIPKGSSWKFSNKVMTDTNWTKAAYNDSTWGVGLSPFGASYSSSLVKSPFGNTNYFFRTNFTIPTGSVVKKLLLSVAADDYAKVFINGFLVDDDVAWHEAAYWNRRIYVNTSVLIPGVNQISVVVYNMDSWAFFDCEISAKYADLVVQAATPCNSTCVNGQCIQGKCVCDSGWTGNDCSANLCSFSDSLTQVVVPAGSSFRYFSPTALAATPSAWFTNNYDDGWWQYKPAPFATAFYYTNRATTIPNTRFLYRKKFLVEVPSGQAIVQGTLSLATDDTHRVYINGKFVGSPIVPYDAHYAKTWNDVIIIPGSFLTDGLNVIAVEVPLMDGRWSAYFNAELKITFATRTCAAPPVPRSLDFSSDK